VTLAAFGPLTPGPLQYAFQTIDAPGADVTAGFVNTFINNSGVIGQDYVDTAGNLRFAVRNGNTWQVVEVPGAVFTLGPGPNNAGRVGLTWCDYDACHLAIWQEDRPIHYVPDIPPMVLPYHWAFANNFNERGIATGWTFLPWTDPELAYGYVQDTHTGAYHFIIYPGADILWTNAQATNDRGTTVGCYTTLTYENHAFAADGDTFTNIDVPGGTNQFAASINNAGYIAGNYTDASGATVGFVRDPMGRVTNLIVPQALQTVPNSITDNLKVAGYYQAQDGTWHGFVATPAR
jgi:hypothetical protein